MVVESSSQALIHSFVSIIIIAFMVAGLTTLDDIKSWITRLIYIVGYIFLIRWIIILIMPVADYIGSLGVG